MDGTLLVRHQFVIASEIGDKAPQSRCAVDRPDALVNADPGLLGLLRQVGMAAHEQADFGAVLRFEKCRFGVLLDRLEAVIHEEAVGRLKVIHEEDQTPDTDDCHIQTPVFCQESGWLGGATFFLICLNPVPWIDQMHSYP
ncbi:hypothetical protein SPHV1_420022 [Novosphingobium sp. KN65.2]|nr:hypothetical protein SPHV1_420022 [Novosphingobium sp. KN65.2]